MRRPAPLALDEDLCARGRLPRRLGHVLPAGPDDHGHVDRAGVSRPRRARGRSSAGRRPRARTLGRLERIRTPSPAASTMVRQRRASRLDLSEAPDRLGGEPFLAPGPASSKIPICPETKCVSRRRKIAYRTKRLAVARGARTGIALVGRLALHRAWETNAFRSCCQQRVGGRRANETTMHGAATSRIPGMGDRRSGGCGGIGRGRGSRPRPSRWPSPFPSPPTPC